MKWNTLACAVKKSKSKRIKSFWRKSAIWLQDMPQLKNLSVLSENARLGDVHMTLLKIIIFEMIRRAWNVCVTSAFTCELKFMILNFIFCVMFNLCKCRNWRRSPYVQHIAKHSSDSWGFIAFYCNCRLTTLVKVSEKGWKAGKTKERMKEKCRSDRKTLRRSIESHFHRKIPWKSRITP